MLITRRMRYTRAIYIVIYLLVLFSDEKVQGVSVITCGLHQRAEFECTLDFMPLAGSIITWTINNEIYEGTAAKRDTQILSLNCTEELENSTIQCEEVHVTDPSVPNVPGDVFYVQIQGKQLSYFTLLLLFWYYC